MRNKQLRLLFAIFTAILVTLVGADALFAQGKGRGKGNKGGNREKAVRQDRGRTNKQLRAPRPQLQKQNAQIGRQQIRARGKDRQQIVRPRDVQARQQKARPQRIQRADDWMRRDMRRDQIRRQPDWAGRQGRVDRQPIIRPGKNEMKGRHARDIYRANADIYDDRSARRGRGHKDRDRYDRRGNPRSIPWNRAWPNNYGYERSRYVHARKAERKAAREFEKFLRRAYSVPYYYDRYATDRYFPTYGPGHRHHGRDRLLRSVIFEYGDPYYGDYYDPYYAPTFGGTFIQASLGPVRFSYSSRPDRLVPVLFPYGYTYVTRNYYDPYYYADAYPQRSVVRASFGPVDISLYSEPVWRAYPYRYTYPSVGYYDPVIYSDDLYVLVNYYDPYVPDIYAEDFPAAYIAPRAAGYGVVSNIYTGLIAYGYDQGYNDGLAAAYAGYDDYYRDPYVYQTAVYDPYSYSIGANRRCLSEGYSLGYQDAINDRRYYDGYQDYDVDLVGVLIGDGLNISVRF